MMNIFRIILPLFFIILLSCHKEDSFVEENPKEDKKEFIIEAYFNYAISQNVKYPDVGAKVYIYYDVPTINFFNAEYLDNGIYDKRGLITKPDQIFEVGGSGILTIKRTILDKNITIIVESCKMKPVNTFHLYSPDTPPTKIISIFTVNDLFS